MSPRLSRVEKRAITVILVASALILALAAHLH